MNGNKGLILSIFWIVLGIVLFILSSLEIFKWDTATYKEYKIQKKSRIQGND